MMVLMIITIIATIAAVFLCLAAAAAQQTSFTFNGFDHDALSSKQITLSGIAEIAPGTRYIRLTNTSARQFGRAFYSSPIQLFKPGSGSGSSSSASNASVSSFSTTFVFCISPLYEALGGHGMAFVVAGSLDSSSVFPSQYLGLLNSADMGNASNHLLAVEFDTVQDLEFGDINDNHVGVDVNSMVSTVAAEAGYYRGPEAEGSSMQTMELKSGELIQAWVEYDAARLVLDVSIAPVGQPKPAVPLLSARDLDLARVLVPGRTFVGFSGSTGVISGTHRLLSWSFSSDGSAPPLDLASLPQVYAAGGGASWWWWSSAPWKLAAIAAGGAASCAALVCGLLYWRRRRRGREAVEGWELGLGLHRYSYGELRAATRGFSEAELLGVGGFGRVYRGVLPAAGRARSPASSFSFSFSCPISGRRRASLHVAVKRLSRESGQGEREFLAEMASMGRLRHRHLVQLLGWSRGRRDGELLLVYEYMSNGSLDKLLFSDDRRRRPALDWEQRRRIVRGVAEAVLYLHEGWEQQVLHRDIKASNVLLDAGLNAKLGDFGLARLHEHGHNPHTTKVVGTLGYLAPEFARTGKATAATDVYSFGVLLLEVVTGRRPIQRVPIINGVIRGEQQPPPPQQQDDQQQQEEKQQQQQQQQQHDDNDDDSFLLVDAVWELYTRGRVLDLADPRLEGALDCARVERALVLGLLCAHPDPARRPSMRLAVQILGDEAELPPLSPNPPQIPHFSSSSFSSGHQHRFLLCASSRAHANGLSFSSASLTSIDSNTQISAR